MAISSNRKTRESMDPLLNGAGDLVKDKVLSVFFALVFTRTTSGIPLQLTTQGWVVSQVEEGNPFTLYSTLVRPYLECCAHFWATQYKTDMELLGCVQWRALKMVEDITYENRLRELELVSLKKIRILVNDLTNVHKCMIQGTKEGGAILLSVMPVTGPTGSRHKLRYRKWNTWRLPTVRVAAH